MYWRYAVQDSYKVRLTEDVNTISSSWDPLTEFYIPVTSVPVDSEWWLIIDFAVEWKKDKVYYHRVDGNKLYYYRKNRSNPSVQHDENSYVQMNDVAELLNYNFDNTNDFWYIVNMGTNKAMILWGYVDIWNWVISVNASSVTSLADWTWYAVLDYSDSILKFVSTYIIENHYLVWQIVISSWIITNKTDRRYIDIHKNKWTLNKLAESGGNLLFNGTPIGWGSGTGDMVWPSWAVSWNLAVFDWPTGKVVKDGWPLISIPYNSMSSKSSDTIYQASSKWWLLVLVENNNCSDNVVYSDDNINPTTVVAAVRNCDSSNQSSLTIPILPSKYYKFTWWVRYAIYYEYI